MCWRAWIFYFACCILLFGALYVLRYGCMYVLHMRICRYVYVYLCAVVVAYSRCGMLVVTLHYWTYLAIFDYLIFIDGDIAYESVVLYDL